eukprot:gene4251-6030_t
MLSHKQIWRRLPPRIDKKYDREWNSTSGTSPLAEMSTNYISSKLYVPFTSALENQTTLENENVESFNSIRNTRFSNEIKTMIFSSDLYPSKIESKVNINQKLSNYDKRYANNPFNQISLNVSNVTDNSTKPCRIKSNKNVKFCSTVKVVLIPTVEEYCQASLAEFLWWNSSDFSGFKLSAIEELNLLMEELMISNIREAMKVLYNPDFLLEPKINDFNIEDTLAEVKQIADTVNVQSLDTKNEISVKQTFKANILFETKFAVTYDKVVDVMLVS